MYKVYRYHRPGLIGKRPARRSRLRLGNVGDSINTPGFPGSSTMYGRLGYTGAPTAATVPAAPVVPWYTKIVSALAPVGTAALSVYQQARIDKMNRERLRAGQPPIPPEQYRQYIGPTATAEIGLSPATRNMLLFGGLGLAAVLLLPRLMRR